MRPLVTERPKSIERMRHFSAIQRLVPWKVALGQAMEFVRARKLRNFSG